MQGKKFLVLGTNDDSTDKQVSELSKIHNSTNNGLIEFTNCSIKNDGFYHTTLTDLNFGEILEISSSFDKVIFLDQPLEQWSHWKLLLSSYKLMCEIENQNIVETEFRNNDNIKSFEFFETYVKKNKSFCIYPWINHHENQIAGNGELSLCSRSKPIKHKRDIISWKNDPDFGEIRNKMLAGEKLPEHCSVCYYYEDRNIESYREFETKEWIAKLNISSIEDLNKIESPYYYEIFTSNTCNLMCRGCIPEASHLIAKEARDNGLMPIKSIKINGPSLETIEIDSLTQKHRVYIHGGEPTIMPDVLEFLKTCIKKEKTDFDLSFCTNGQRISTKFLTTINQFQNVNFSFSIDGYGKVNDYWRHGSNWETIIKNAKMLQSYGHSISINTVPGIYNATNLHLLYEFLDREFPMVGVYLQINYFERQSAFNHPNSEMVVESMKKCMNTNIYHADSKSNKTAIDSIYDYHKNNPKCDLSELANFFEDNDRLDEIRGIYLKDYIPELEECRYLIK